MIQRVLIDTDVILDIAIARQPFVESSKLVLSLVENSIALGFVTSNEVTNIYYILRKLGGDHSARRFISELLRYITVISISHSDILTAIRSGFIDFEDGVQHFSAVKNQCDCIVTRNTNDYKLSEIPVYSPVEFLSLFRELI